MISLNDTEKELFSRLSKTDEGRVLKEYILKIIGELSDVDSLTSDIIENRRIVKSSLKAGLIDLLEDRQPAREEPETWD